MGFIVEVSARHVHLTQRNVESLFGKGYNLTVSRYLSQPGQYLSNEKLTVKLNGRCFESVSILGPVRNFNQVELSRTDCIYLKARQFLRESGDISGTESATLMGPAGEISLTEGLIIAQRHIHMTPRDADIYHVTDRQTVSVEVGSDGRRLIFGDTVVRVSESFALAMHIDTDEGNAVMLPRDGGRGEINI